MITTSDEIYAHDIFSAIFCLMVLRDYTGIQPEKSTQAHHHSYDAACMAVYEEVVKLCDATDKECQFYMSLYMGTSSCAREQLLDWQQSRLIYARAPFNGLLYFNIDSEYAEDMVAHIVEKTGFDRPTFERLTKLFLSIYNGG